MYILYDIDSYGSFSDKTLVDRSHFNYIKESCIDNTHTRQIFFKMVHTSIQGKQG